MQQKNRSYDPLDWKRMQVVKADRRSPITDHRPHHNSGWRIKDRYAALIFLLAMAACLLFVYFKTPEARRNPFNNFKSSEAWMPPRTLNAKDGWNRPAQNATDKNLAAILDRIERRK